MGKNYKIEWYMYSKDSFAVMHLYNIKISDVSHLLTQRNGCPPGEGGLIK